MYHKFGVSKYPSTSVTLDQLNSHINEFKKEKYNVLSLILLLIQLLMMEIFQIILLVLV